VLDENDQPTTAAFLIRDAQKRIYPSIAKRLAPDFAFHQQIYRSDGETLKLPDGAYTISLSRGPESLSKEYRGHNFQAAPNRDLQSGNAGSIPSKFGWWSGDHHIHAAGCAHYVSRPKECTRRT